MTHASTRAIVALGSPAGRSLAALSPRVPVIWGMVLKGDAPKRAAGVAVDVPAYKLFFALKTHFPKIRRVAVLHGPDLPLQERMAMALQAREAGVAVQPVECTDPDDMLAKARASRATADLIWLPGDARLFSVDAVRTLIAESWKSGVAVAGFSPAMVRAGAVFAVYPDMKNIGSDIATAVTRALSGSADAQLVTASSFDFAINRKAARIMGIQMPKLENTSDDVTVLSLMD